MGVGSAGGWLGGYQVRKFSFFPAGVGWDQSLHENFADDRGFSNKFRENG